MLKLVIVGAVGLIFIFALIIIIRNKPDLWFWLFLNLFFDPGGYVEEYLGGTLIGPLTIADVSLAGIVICLLFANINWKVVFGDRFLLKFLFALIIFSLYYFIVYGGVVPYFHNDLNYSTFFLKNRLFFYGFIILISVYIFSLRGLQYFYNITLFIGTICLSLYLIALLTGLKLIPVWTLLREGTEMMRISMLSYGLFDLVFPLALTAYLLSRKIKLKLKFKRWLYYSGIVMLITLLITLTRRTQIDIIGLVIIIILIVSYLFRTAKLLEIFKIVIPALLVILVLYFTFPKYVGYIVTAGEDTFLLMTTGKDSRGERDERVSSSGALDVTKEYIRNNLLFGTGYTHLQWLGPGRVTSKRGETFAIASDAAGEVPIYYLFFGFGIAGAILMLPLYYMMGVLFYKLIKLLRLTLMYHPPDPIILIFSIYILLTIAQKFTINLYALSSDFRAPGTSIIAVSMGLGFALYRKLYLNIYAESQ